MGSFPQPFLWLVWSALLVAAHKNPTKVLHLKTMESIESIRPPNLKDELFLSPKLGITIVENDDVPEVGWDLAGFPVFPTLFSDIWPEGSVSRPMLWVPWPRFHKKTDHQKTAERCRRPPPLGASWIWVPQFIHLPQPFQPFCQGQLSYESYPQASSTISSSIIHHQSDHQPDPHPLNMTCRPPRPIPTRPA